MGLTAAQRARKADKAIRKLTGELRVGDVVEVLEDPDWIAAYYAPSRKLGLVGRQGTVTEAHAHWGDEVEVKVSITGGRGNSLIMSNPIYAMFKSSQVRLLGIAKQVKGNQ